MFCLEVFAGSARLTASLRRSGFTDSVGLDSKLRARLPAPVLCIDLLDDKSRPIVDSLLDSPNLCYIHFRPPVTPGRSLQHPDGLPDLQARDSTLYDRVSRVNRLWNLTGEILTRSFQAGILFSCENPTASHLWASSGFASHSIDLPLLRTTFDHCTTTTTTTKRLGSRVAGAPRTLFQCTVFCFVASPLLRVLQYGMGPRLCHVGNKQSFAVLVMRTGPAHTGVREP